MKEITIVIAGFGVVGQSFATLITEKNNYLHKTENRSLKIVGISGSSKGSVLNAEGLPLGEICQAVKDGRTIDSVCDGEFNLSTLDMIEKSNAQVLVEATPTNFVDGQPGLSHIEAALRKGMHVITVNKGPVALHYERLVQMARENGVALLIEGTVVSGTPVVSLAKNGLRGASLKSVKGILNGTTNYILCEMEKGLGYDEALLKAQELGYAETDPTGDVEGHDAAGKVLIIAKALFNSSLAYSDIECSGISHITASMVAQAQEQNMRYKLLGEVFFDDSGSVQGRVKAVKVPVHSFLGSISGPENGLVFDTDVLGKVCIQGPGAGGRETAFAVLSDLLSFVD